MLMLATPADLPEVCDLLRVMHAENGIGKVHEAKALGVITSRINEGGCVLSRNKGKLVGSVAVYKSTWWYSEEVALFDQWFFVHPAHRTEGHAVRLIAALKQACRDSGMPLVFSVGSPIDALSKLKFFKKHLTPFGGSFLFDPKTEKRAA